MTNYKFTVVVEQDEDGWFANVPELQGCFTQGDNYEELIENLKDIVRGHVELRLERGEEIQQSSVLSVTSLEIAL